MRKLIYIALITLSALVSCKKQDILPQVNNEISQANVTLNLTVEKAGLGSDMKSVKTDWENGDMIFLFFKANSATSASMISVNYNGISWDLSDPGMQSSLNHFNNTEGKVLAVYFKVFPSEFQHEEVYYSFGETAYGETLASELTDFSCTDNSISLHMTLNQIGKSQITISNISDASKWELLPMHGKVSFKGIKEFKVGGVNGSDFKLIVDETDAVKGVANIDLVKGNCTAFYLTTLSSASNGTAFILHNTETNCYYYRTINDLTLERGDAYNITGPVTDPVTGAITTANGWAVASGFEQLGSDVAMIQSPEPPILTRQSAVDKLIFLLGNTVNWYASFNDFTILTLFGEVIPSEAFYSCSSLSTVIFPKNLTTIGGQAFSMTALTSITLPTTLTSINAQAFYACSELTTITIKATTPPTIPLQSELDAFEGCPLTAIYVPSESVATYKSTPGWSDYAGIISAIPTE